MPRSAGTIQAMRRQAQSGRVRSQLLGVQRTKRLMADLPDAMREQLTDAMARSGRLTAAEMQQRAPKKTQALAAGISSKVYGRTLRMRAGLIGTPGGRAKLFYGRIQDLGRKAQNVVVTRHMKGGRWLWKGKSRVQNFGSYILRVRAMAPKRFITGRFPGLRAALGKELSGVWNRALAMIGAGNG